MSSLLLDHLALARYASQKRPTRFAIPLKQTWMRQTVIYKVAKHTSVSIQSHLMDFYQVIQVDFMIKSNRSMVFYDIVFEWSKFYFWNLDRKSIQEASAGISNIILLNIFIMYSTCRDILFKFY